MSTRCAWYYHAHLAGGTLLSPADPPQGIRKAANPLVAYSVQRMLSAGHWRFWVSNPSRLSATFSALHHDQGDCRSPWTHRAKGYPRPLQPRPGLSCPEPRPVFRHRLRAKARCLLSLCDPIDQGHGCAPGPGGGCDRCVASRRPIGKRGLRAVWCRSLRLRVDA